MPLCGIAFVLLLIGSPASSGRGLGTDTCPVAVDAGQPAVRECVRADLVGVVGPVAGLAAVGDPAKDVELLVAEFHRRAPGHPLTRSWPALRSECRAARCVGAPGHCVTFGQSFLPRPMGRRFCSADSATHTFNLTDASRRYFAAGEARISDAQTAKNSRRSAATTSTWDRSRSS